MLRALGDRVREARTRRGLTRKALARGSDVSERHIAQLESGQGNISILLLGQIGAALGLPVAELLRQVDEEPAELALIHQFLRRLPPQRLARVREQIAAAEARAGRPAGSVKLVAITKYAGPPEAAALVAAGCQDLGESRPQELWRKAEAVANSPVRCSSQRSA